MANIIKISPILKEWEEIRKQLPENSVLLFKIGDFYETYHDQAKNYAAILELTVTTRKGVPLLGIPSHIVKESLEKLTLKGIKCFIADINEPYEDTLKKGTRTVISYFS